MQNKDIGTLSMAKHSRQHRFIIIIYNKRMHAIVHIIIPAVAIAEVAGHSRNDLLPVPRNYRSWSNSCIYVQVL